jgi:hypothetical protein
LPRPLILRAIRRVLDRIVKEVQHHPQRRARSPSTSSGSRARRTSSVCPRHRRACRADSTARSTTASSSPRPLCKAILPLVDPRPRRADRPTSRVSSVSWRSMTLRDHSCVESPADLMR